MIRLGVVNRDPDVREHSRTVRIENRERCARFDGAKISVAAGGIGARNALKDIGLRLSEVRLPMRCVLSMRHILRGRSNQQEQKPGKKMSHGPLPGALGPGLLY